MKAPSVFTEAPFLRIILPAILGLLAAAHLSQYKLSIAFFLIYFGIQMLFLWYRNYKFQFHFRILIGISFYLFIGSLYYFRSNLSQSQQIIRECNAQAYAGQIVEEPQTSGLGLKAICRLSHYYRNGKTQKCSHDILLYLPADSNLHEGSVLLFHASLKRINEPSNPHQFDARQYWKLKDINYCATIKSNQFLIGKQSTSPRLMHYILAYRQTLANIIDTGMTDANAKQVTKALLLGIMQDMDKELLSDYSGIGVIHVLSVSGLHVGIFYLMLEFLLGGKKRRFGISGRLFKSVVSLVLIWLYAALTGFSPSVLRSAMMLTFIISGKTFLRDISVYNSVAASMVCLLFYRPLLLYDIGFQLSYLSVFGMIYLQPKIHALIKLESSILNYCWQMCSASLAAQVCTSALSIYYFHQFPLLFLFSNLLIIPLVSIALPLGLCSLVLAQILPNKFLHYLFIPLEYNIRLVNFLVRLFADLPYHSIQGLWLSKAAFLLLSLAMLCFGFAMEWKQRVLYLLFFFSLYSFLLIIFCDHMSLARQRQMVLYQNRRSAEVSVFLGKEEWHFMKENTGLSKIRSPAADANRVWHGISKVHELHFPKGNYLLEWHGKKCCFYEGKQQSKHKKYDAMHIMLASKRSAKMPQAESWLNIWAAGDTFTYSKLQNQRNNSIIDLRKHAAIILNF
jgi:competence protein ComEC